MAETRLTNVVIPTIFSKYTMEPSIYRNRFYKCGIIARDTQLDALLAGGGRTFNVPFWQDVDDAESHVPSEFAQVGISAINAATQVSYRLARERAWGANALTSILSGDNPMEAIANRVIDYWTREYDKILVAICQGVINDNVANDGSDLVNDVSGTASPLFSDSAVIDTQALLGENGVVGRGDSEDFVGIGIHPDTYAYMRKLDLIDFVAISGQTRPLEFYMGMEVIVDRRMPKDVESDGYRYITIMYKKNAFSFGQTANGYEPTSVDRDNRIGFGIDQLFTRRVFCMHPLGFAFLDANVAGEFATNTELQSALNWNRVFQQENIRFCALIHELG